MNQKPLASISMDLDNKWSYLKTQGGDGWRGFPSYLDYAVPRILKFLHRRNLKITVFVIGQDAVLEKNHQPIRQIAAAGHELGNHSFNHEPWLHLYSPEEIAAELERTEAAIHSLTGQRTIGFRGPGFSFSDDVLDQLVQRGYQYDATRFPTYLGPLARLYTFFKSRLTREQKEERKSLFGTWTDGFGTLHPHLLGNQQGSILEIPVTTMPIVKAPIHGSYVLYLAGYSKALAKAYFWMAMKLCRLFKVEPSLLLHPLDFLGCDDEPELSFFPAMNQQSADKIEIMSECIKMLARNFEPVTMEQHARSVRKQRLATTHPVKNVEGAFAGTGSVVSEEV